MIQSSSRVALAALAVSLAFASTAARADVQLNITSNDRSACPDPAFGACYIGVDGARIGTIVENGSATFTFVGLGVQSSELPGVTFPAGGAASPPSGTLEMKPGSNLTIGGTFNPARPFDTSVFVGLGNGSIGQIDNNGGSINTPLLSIGEQDTRVSQGFVNVFNGGTIAVGFNADPNQGSTVPGLTAISIGRGAGSTGDLNIQGVGSSVSVPHASVSIGRDGTGSLEVLSGATFSTGGSIYGSIAATDGHSSIVVSGTGSVLTVGGNLLVGIAGIPSTGSQLNEDFDATSTLHGTSDLNVTNGGAVHGNVVVGAGGTVHGTGNIVGNLTVLGGTTSPGNSPGTLHVQGNYVMNGGLYIAEIAGTGPGQTDLIDVTGTADLTNATILFKFIDGFSPTAGFSFDFLDAAGGLTESGLTFMTAGLADGFQFGTSIENGVAVFTALSDGTFVPEPGEWALLAIGLFALLACARTRGRAMALRLA
jgi:T5SS/PEP-CTERM-associated repeat protein